jgi:hypothetical protein
MPLAESLLADNKLTIVGTLRINRREIPQSLISPRGKQVQSCQHTFHGPQTSVSYNPKNKSVMLFSRMHKTADVQDTVKPEIIQFYDKTKGCVDTLNQLWHTYSVSRKTRRWPMSVL